MRGQKFLLIALLLLGLVTSYLLMVVPSYQFNDDLRRAAEYVSSRSTPGGELTGNAAVAPSIAFQANLSLSPEGVELYLPYRLHIEPNEQEFYDRITANASYAFFRNESRNVMPFYAFLNATGVYRYPDSGFYSYIQERFVLENTTGTIIIYSRKKP